MTSRDFCYWLQGFFEISTPQIMLREQVEMVQKHLALVFAHEIDPSMGSAQHQEGLDKIHDTTTTFSEPAKFSNKLPYDINYRC